MILENWDDSAKVTFDRALWSELTTLRFLENHHHVLILGAVGVGKTFLACALGHSACRVGAHVRFVKLARLLQGLHQSRADNSFERELRSWVVPDLIVIDDLGLRKLSAQQSSDFYDVLVERHTRVSTVLTSNRAVDEWVALFDDPILANSALDRFAHRAHQIVMEGPSLRAAKAPSKMKGVASTPRTR
jgi:DNA replication protein DnaC